MECPLASLVYRLAGHCGIPGIFFPDWFASKIMPVSAVVFVIGAALVVRNIYLHRKSNKQVETMRTPRV